MMIKMHFLSDQTLHWLKPLNSIFLIPTLDLQHDFVFTIQLAYRIFLRFIFLWEEVLVPTAQIQHYCL